MDLSMILSPDVGYDDDTGDYSNHRHNSRSQPQYSPPAHNNQQQEDDSRADGGYSAAEMQCAVAILQDFQPPQTNNHNRKSAAASSPHGRHHSRGHVKQQAPPPFMVAGGGRRELLYHDDDGEERKTDDEDAGPSHHNPAATSSGWASGSDLMSKLDLLVQADEMIQSSSSGERPRLGVVPSVDTSAATAPAATLDDGEFVRSGVWTRAEEEYAAALIYYFLKGLLPLKEGTTLRKFLAEKLCCNRRRVSMKLATESIANKKIPRKVGASVFVVAHPAPSADEKDHVLDTLTALRAACFDPAAASPSLESRQRPNKTHDELPELLLQAPNLDSLSPSQYHSQSHQSQSSQHHYESEEPTYQDHESPQKENRSKQPSAPAAATSHSFMRASSSSAKPQFQSLETTPKKTQKKKPLLSTSYRHHREPIPELLRSPPGTGNIKRRKPTIIRTGFESVEEERYVTAMFEYFMAGVLELPEGTKLIGYLCSQLGCSPKTLSMKLAPRRLGERKFPDNVGSITYMRKDAKRNVFLYENSDAIAARLTELRVAAFDYEHATPTQSTAQPKNHQSHNSFTFAAHETNSVKSERKNSTASNSSSAASPSRLQRFSRSGPWSREEELYAASLIDCFFKGMLDIAEGTTLRAFLSSRLCCNPMRISKKLASEWIADIKIPKKLGSSTFVRRGSGVTAREHAETEAALRKLQQAYLHSETIKDSGGDAAEVAGRSHSDSETEDDTKVVGVKHSRQEEPEDDEDSALSSEEEEAADNADSSATSSDDDIKSLSGKSPKKIRKVLASYSPQSAAKRVSSHSAKKSPATTTTRRYRVEDEAPSSPVSTHFNERVAPMAY